MGEPFIGEIKIVSFDFPPRGWAQCDGATLAISQNQALFSILGTTFGGNGVNNFSLPNFQGCAPMHPGGDLRLALGQTGGEAAHTLITGEMPGHTHLLQANNNPDADNADPTGRLFGKSATSIYAAPGAGPSTIDPTTVSQVGQSQPHQNMHPFLVLNFIIALQGIFPSRN